MIVLALDRAGWTGVAVAAAVGVVALVELALHLRVEDRATRFQVRRSLRFGAGLVLALVLAGIWHVFNGRIGLVVGLGAAGLGFALQEVIGAVFGWISILSGNVFRIGDRVSLAGVEGDVIDLTPLRTTILEMGTPVELGSKDEASPPWVRGRQYTGRIVAVPNHRVLQEPVYNYSAVFEYVWEELTVPVAYRSDWREAERILLEEAEHVSDSAQARAAMEAMEARYPVPHSEVEPRVFVRATENWWEMSARFIIPVRTSRTVKSDLTKRVRERFEAAGIDIASSTAEQYVRFPDGLPPGERER